MTKYCPFCGEQLVDSAKFCKNCGKEIGKYSNLTNDEPNQFQHTPPAVEKSHTWAFVLGIVFSFLIPLIGVIIGIYIYTRKDSSKAKFRGVLVIALALIVWIFSIIINFLWI